MERKKRNYAPEVKQRALQRLENNDSLTTIAQDEGVNFNTLVGWQYQQQGRTREDTARPVEPGDIVEVRVVLLKEHGHYLGQRGVVESFEPGEIALRMADGGLCIAGQVNLVRRSKKEAVTATQTEVASLVEGKPTPRFLKFIFDFYDNHPGLTDSQMSWCFHGAFSETDFYLWRFKRDKWGLVTKDYSPAQAKVWTNQYKVREPALAQPKTVDTSLSVREVGKVYELFKGQFHHKAQVVDGWVRLKPLNNDQPMSADEAEAVAQMILEAVTIARKGQPENDRPSS